MLMYCKKCGRIVQDAKICDICNSTTYPVPKEYWLNGRDFLINPKLEDQFIEKYIKSSLEFDEELFNARDQIRAEQRRRYEQDMAIGKAILDGADPKIAFKNAGKNLPKCPTCGSLSVEKIGGLERAASVGFWGLFSNKINKTYKCKNCGHTW